MKSAYRNVYTILVPRDGAADAFRDELIRAGPFEILRLPSLSHNALRS